MKLDEVKRAIATGRIRLGPSDSVRHYLPVFLAAGLVSAALYLFLVSFSETLALWIALIPFIGALGIAVALRRQLKFIRIATSLSKNAARTAVQEVIEREGWKVEKRTKRLLICRTDSNHVVTVIIADGEVLVSSRSSSDIGWAYLYDSGNNVAAVASHISRSGINPRLVSMK